jgi:hypothetical protein
MHLSPAGSYVLRVDPTPPSRQPHPWSWVLRSRHPFEEVEHSRVALTMRGQDRVPLGIWALDSKRDLEEYC